VVDAGCVMADLASQIQISTMLKNCLDLENLNKKQSRK
jgi:hypothetical protein